MSKKNNTKKLVKKTDNKQKMKKDKKLSNKQKRNFEIIGFVCSILLLVFLLFIIKINTDVKSKSKKIMNDFNEAYSSSNISVVFYYNSDEEDNIEYEIENRYLIDLKKEFKFEYIEIDVSKLSEKSKNEVNGKLGIEGVNPSIIVVQDEKVLGLSEGFIESHNLVDLFKQIGLLNENDKFSQISNLKFIDYNDYKKIIKEKDINVIIVGKAACEYCMNAKPTLNNISKAYKKEFNYLDLSDLSSEDLKSFFENIEKNGYDDENLKENGSFSTPTILLTKDGKIISYLAGYRKLEEYIDYLKENKAIE